MGIKIVRTLKLFVIFSKNHFTSFFSSFNPNIGYGNQRLLFSGNLPRMSVIVCVCFYAKFLLDHFLLEHSFDLLLEWLFHSRFLSDLNCTHSEFKPLAQIKLLWEFVSATLAGSIHFAGRSFGTIKVSPAYARSILFAPPIIREQLSVAIFGMFLNCLQLDRVMIRVILRMGFCVVNEYVLNCTPQLLHCLYSFYLSFTWMV